MTSASLATPTPSSYCLAFDGTQNYTTTPASNAFSPAGSFTLEMWLNTNDSPSIAMGNWNGSNKGVFMEATGSAGSSTPPGYFRCGMQFTTQGFLEILYPWSWAAGWNHWALVWNSSAAGVYLYQNGQQVAMSPNFHIGDSLVTSPTAFTLGQINSGFGYAAFSIGPVRLSNTARYQNSFLPASSWPSDANTVFVYNMAAGLGTTLVDDTGNHNGTLTGSPLPTWSNFPLAVGISSPNGVSFGGGLFNNLLCGGLTANSTSSVESSASTGSFTQYIADVLDAPSIDPNQRLFYASDGTSIMMDYSSAPLIYYADGLTPFFDGSNSNLNADNGNIFLNLSGNVIADCGVDGHFCLDVANRILYADDGTTHALDFSSPSVATFGATIGIAGTSGPGASVGTLTNAPSVGNPTAWVPFQFNGVTKHFPAW